jgi:hypothetical protein
MICWGVHGEVVHTRLQGFRMNFGADSGLYSDEDFGLHFLMCRDGICDVEFVAFHVSAFCGEDNMYLMGKYKKKALKFTLILLIKNIFYESKEIQDYYVNLRV